MSVVKELEYYANLKADSSPCRDMSALLLKAAKEIRRLEEEVKEGCPNCGCELQKYKACGRCPEGWTHPECPVHSKYASVRDLRSPATVVGPCGSNTTGHLVANSATRGPDIAQSARSDGLQGESSGPPRPL